MYIDFLLRQFQIPTEDYQELISLLKQDIIQLESIDPNVKFILRKENWHIYRNRVKMDLVVLACQILSSSLKSIFEHSLNEKFKKELARIVKTKKSQNIETVIGSMLLAQANSNYINVFDQYYKR